MYKTLSTALQRPISRYAITGLFLTVLAFVTYHNWAEIDGLKPEGMRSLVWAGTAVLSLTFLNLFCEAKKWEQLIASQDIGWKEALAQVVAGICSGFLTPNRVGEFAGRRFFLPHDQKYKALTLTAAGSTMQGSITLGFGLVGLAVFPLPIANLYGSQIQWFWLLVIGLISILLVLGLRKRWRFLEDIRASFAHISQFSVRRILSVFSWALLRYFVFSTQFVLALSILGFEGSVAMCYTGVFLLYLCQSYIPGASLGELGVREVLAVLIFGSFMPNPLLAAVAGFMLWVANIGIPVLLGSFSFGLGRSTFR